MGQLFVRRSVEQAEALKVATTEFMNSWHFASRWGQPKFWQTDRRLAQTEAYLNVMTYLASDELDPLDVDLAVQALQGECINAMTPEVLARATVDEPFDMTTFVVNPNIYQDATDDEGNPTDIRINGWTLETNADRAPRTGPRLVILGCTRPVIPVMMLIIFLRLRIIVRLSVRNPKCLLRQVWITNRRLSCGGRYVLEP